MRAELSYDLVMEDDMGFVEGAYRLPGMEWQVFIFSRCDMPEPWIEPARWESGVTGLYVQFSRSARLNRPVVERVLAAALDIGEWVVVCGPDSMQLR